MRIKNQHPFLSQTRRKTATPEELLHTKDNKMKNPQLKIYDEITEDILNSTTPADAPELNRKQVLAETFQLDEKTLKKLVDLEKTLKDKKTMPPPSLPSNATSTTTTANTTTNNSLNTNFDDKLGPRSGSFNGTPSAKTSTENNSENLEPGGGNFVRNSRVSSSARPFRKTVSASNIKKRGSNPSSARSSPQMERKSLNDTQLSV